MSILEEQSDEECAILLSCSRRDVMARLLASQRIVKTIPARGLRNDLECCPVFAECGLVAGMTANAEELTPLILWSTGRELNPRILVLQTSALATSPSVPYVHYKTSSI